VTMNLFLSEPELTALFEAEVRRVHPEFQLKRAVVKIGGPRGNLIEGVDLEIVAVEKSQPDQAAKPGEAK